MPYSFTTPAQMDAERDVLTDGADTVQATLNNMMATLNGLTAELESCQTSLNSLKTAVQTTLADITTNAFNANLAAAQPIGALTTHDAARPALVTAGNTALDTLATWIASLQTQLAGHNQALTSWQAECGS